MLSLAIRLSFARQRSWQGETIASPSRVEVAGETSTIHDLVNISQQGLAVVAEGRAQQEAVVVGLTLRASQVIHLISSAMTQAHVLNMDRVLIKVLVFSMTGKVMIVRVLRTKVPMVNSVSLIKVFMRVVKVSIRITMATIEEAISTSTLAISRITIIVPIVEVGTTIAALLEKWRWRSAQTVDLQLPTAAVTERGNVVASSAFLVRVLLDR
jgi:hypothetical protein